MKRLRVLVAEDEQTISTALVEQLCALDYCVVGEAATGAEVIQMAAEMKPDVLIMDIMMPDIDGIEAARQISQHNPLPIVFLSGHFDEDLLSGVVESGGMAYLLKPATAEQLKASLSVATKQFKTIANMKDQAAKLSQALAARKMISRAKGLLMQRYGITEEEAHRRLQKEASRNNSKLVDLARSILTAGALITGLEAPPRDSSK